MPRRGSFPSGSFRPIPLQQFGRQDDPTPSCSTESAGRRERCVRVAGHSSRKTKETRRGHEKRSRREAVVEVSPAGRGATYQVRSRYVRNGASPLSIRWLVGYARERARRPWSSASRANSSTPYNQPWQHVQKKEGTPTRLARRNKAFAHYAGKSAQGRKGRFVSRVSPLDKTRNIGSWPTSTPGRRRPPSACSTTPGVSHKMGEVHDGTPRWTGWRGAGEGTPSPPRDNVLLAGTGSTSSIPRARRFTIEWSVRFGFSTRGAVFCAVGAWSPSPNGVRQADKFRVPRSPWSIKWTDRRRFRARVRMMKERLRGESRPIQLPLGRRLLPGDHRSGPVKAVVWKRTPSERSSTTSGSADMAAEVAAARERLLEAVADVDDTLVESTCGQEIPVRS